MEDYDTCEVDLWDNKNKRQEAYTLKGSYHRLNGPAIIYYFYSGAVLKEYYIQHGYMHREDGPAEIHYHSYGKIDTQEYWVHGKKININPFVHRLIRVKNKDKIFVRILEENKEEQKLLAVVLTEIFKWELSPTLIENVRAIAGL